MLLASAGAARRSDRAVFGGSSDQTGLRCRSKEPGNHFGAARPRGQSLTPRLFSAAGHQRRVAPLHRRRRLHRPALVVHARLGTPPGRGPDRPAILDFRQRAPASATSKTFRPTSRYSTSATSRPRRTRPGPVPGCPPRRNGRRPAPGTRRPAPGAATRGEPRRRRKPAPTSVAPRCVRRRSAPTRTALRPTGSSRCSATSGSGPAHRCGPGPGSSR